MPELIVVTGPPGAGKSTVARLLSARYPLSALVAGDAVFAFLDQGYRAPWTREAHQQNTVTIEAAAAAAGRFVLGGYTVVFDGIVGPWFLDEFLAASGLAALRYAVLLPDVDTCVRRVLGRTGHPFADVDATRHMHGEFARSALDPRHLVSGTTPPRTPRASPERPPSRPGSTPWSRAADSRSPGRSVRRRRGEGTGDGDHGDHGGDGEHNDDSDDSAGPARARRGGDRPQRAAESCTSTGPGHRHGSTRHARAQGDPAPHAYRSDPSSRSTSGRTCCSSSCSSMWFHGGRSPWR
ncbi:AAA family ATPase [Actinomycetospora sp. C-140]